MTPFSSVLIYDAGMFPSLVYTRALYIPADKPRPGHKQHLLLEHHPIYRLLHSSSTTIIIMQRFVYLFVFALIGQ